ncbi:hypothetical protein BRADI_2g13243v3 [Brachypodium distachyon]|uniref:Uncharacterized protein n=1 Tax=Brachypodium distachyon TaxID=15368 RepID=A0A2K2D8B6_BRADI|nr:hypothetical protein BRADI_2g13243v3 [Brachypodium distachyon]
MEKAKAKDKNGLKPEASNGTLGTEGKNWESEPQLRFHQESSAKKYNCN